MDFHPVADFSAQTSEVGRHDIRCGGKFGFAKPGFSPLLHAVITSAATS